MTITETDNLQALIETMNAWRDARDTLPQGSKKRLEADENYRKAQAEYFKQRK
jgi:hypothetical protein